MRHKHPVSDEGSPRMYSLYVRVGAAYHAVKISVNFTKKAFNS